MRPFLRSTLVVGSALFLMCGGQVRAADEAASKPSITTPPGAASGVKIYIDPETGEILDRPPEGAAPSAVEPAARAAGALEQVPSPVPGGGIGVDVRGRFQTPLDATIGPDGNPVMRHRDAASQ